MRLINGECLEEMAKLQENSVNCVMVDVPYGTTACKWDEVIPFEPMWAQLQRVVRVGGALVFTAAQPFTSALVMSNPAHFRFSWVWEKQQGTNPMLAKKQPMKVHEDVLVFSVGKAPVYNPQMTQSTPYGGFSSSQGKTTGEVMGKTKSVHRDNPEGTRYPRSVQRFNTERGKSWHPTQKPLELIEYLVETHSNRGDVVLDFTMGSGTTGVACKNLGRDFIGIELDEEYFAKAKERIENA